MKGMLDTTVIIVGLVILTLVAIGYVAIFQVDFIDRITQFLEGFFP